MRCVGHAEPLEASRPLSCALIPQDMLARAMEPMSPACERSAGAASPKQAMDMCKVTLLGEGAKSPQRQFMATLDKLCARGSGWKPHLYNSLVAALPRAKAAATPAGRAAKVLVRRAAKPVPILAPPPSMA